MCIFLFTITCIYLHIHTYSVSNNFSLKLIEPSARDVEGQALTLFQVLLALSHVLFSFLTRPPPALLLPSKE